jgi:hypothetical protein
MLYSGRYDMKTLSTLVIAFLISMCAYTVYGQAIPPRGDGEDQSSLPISFDPNRDFPGKAGSYLVEGGGHIYYQKGDYNKTGTDSTGSRYTPWGMSFNPSAEFFLFNEKAFGATAIFNFEKDGADKTLEIGIGPIFSYYATKWRTVIPYVSVFGLYQHSNLYLGNTGSMYWVDQALIGGVKVGVIYMLSRQGGVFVDGRFTYGRHKVTNPPATTQSKQTGWDFESYIGFKYFIY